MTEAFLAHFGLDSVADLPGVDELKAAGLLDSRIPANFSIPDPKAGEGLAEDEDPLEDGDSGGAIDEYFLAVGAVVIVIARPHKTNPSCADPGWRLPPDRTPIFQPPRRGSPYRTGRK